MTINIMKSFILVSLLMVGSIAHSSMSDAQIVATQKAANNGDANAQYKIGYMYFDSGQFKKAAIWLMKAANKGQADAQNLLGLQYGLGWGVPQNFKTSEFWNKKSAAQGNKKAIKALKTLAHGKVHRANQHYLIYYLSPAKEASKKGDHKQAIEHIKKGLEFRKKELGPDHMRVGNSYGHLGYLYRKTGQYDKALTNFQEALKIRIKQKGPGDILVAQSYYSLSLLYNAKAESKQAVSYAIRALTIAKKLYGPDHFKTKGYLKHLKTLEAKK